MTVLLWVLIVASVGASLFFSILSYALRDFSRARLGDYLDVHGKSRLLEPIVEQTHDLIFVTAMGRLVANVVILLCMLRVFENPQLVRGKRGAFVRASRHVALVRVRR